ncbi:peptidase S41 [Antarcticibacterium flavum]|uniref:Peptidase S41 n=1 Tax=Antarcticibacterium flavum TaxID=2058175 RepID=A0A5B7X948_9FLAO|nr:MULTISPECIES: S41 family peptidase [Antarcticibacterium]MCM4160364.1 peptidase S41 [Antarcticibacterium sp. W02-3]QCY71258.1 peptidase S41 [Antarcticibacterium flavum]
MKNIKIFFLTLLAGSFFASCSSDNEEFEEKPDVTATTEESSKELEVENFIYRGMSDIYLYKDDLDVLAENYFASQGEKDAYLKTFSSPEKLFNSLKSSRDRFSYLIDNYETMKTGTIASTGETGMSFGLVSYCQSCTEVFGYIKLVQPNTPAAAEGAERGMIFNRVNGQQLTKSNYTSLLTSSSYTLGLAKIEGNTITELDRTINISTRDINTNPVVISKVLEVNGIKTGYLFYNSFDEDFDEELNSAFNELKGAGIQELVLDLRYNGGGSVRTATDLAAMITGQFVGEVFMKERWNEKYQSYYEQRSPESLLNKFNTSIRTGTTINSLNLNRLFVLTTKSSASASELIINGLDPYIDVVQIGDVTTGKFEASVTLYDSPNFSEDHSSLNDSHTYAIQPLVLKSMNRDGVTDYKDGINPEIKLPEDVLNLGILGDKDEPLLKVALDVIAGNRVSIPEVKTYDGIGESGMFDPGFQTMYIDKVPVEMQE